MTCLIYADDIWGLDDVYIDIGDLRTFLRGNREVVFKPFKEIFEKDYSVVGAQ